MTESEARLDATLRVAEEVAAVLASHGAAALLIGGVAVALHRFPRDTVDLDLATSMHPRLLDEVADELRSRGHAVTVHAPDAADPLGGVIDIRAAGADLVQVVNFHNPPAQGFPRLVADAAATSEPITSDTTLRVADLPHLIVFKLYAGGRKSALDILELLDRNPELDREHLRALCRTYRMERQLDAVLALG